MSNENIHEFETLSNPDDNDSADDSAVELISGDHERNQQAILPASTTEGLQNQLSDCSLASTHGTTYVILNKGEKCVIFNLIFSFRNIFIAWLSSKELIIIECASRCKLPSRDRHLTLLAASPSITYWSSISEVRVKNVSSARGASFALEVVVRTVIKS